MLAKVQNEREGTKFLKSIPGPQLVFGARFRFKILILQTSLPLRKFLKGKGKGRAFPWQASKGSGGGSQLISNSHKHVNLNF